MTKRPFDILDRLSVGELGELAVRLRESGRKLQEPVAVVGIGCRLPGGADDPDAYWRLLTSGVDAVGSVPPERWNSKAWEGTAAAQTMRAGFLGDVSGFDPGFFGIAPREVTTMDPQHRLVLEVAWEALERSGYRPASLAGRRVGVFLGVTSNDWRIRSGREPWFSDVYRLPGTGACFAAGRISYILGLSGPSVVVDTACSSSLSAVHLACQSLLASDSDMVLAGGVNLILHPDVSVMASGAGMLSPVGLCKTFDASADGFVRGEGCGIVVLKRLADALQDRDEILAVIAGTAMNQDGASSGLMVPNGMAQRAVIRDALAAAAIDPVEVQYVEAHGTGTRLGDPIEINALQDVLAPAGARTQPLLVGSVKTNIGHLEGAAGVAGLIKLVLAAHYGEIPPSLHFEEPNPLIPWADIDVAVAAARTRWQPQGSRRIGGISAFGASGTNVHVVVTSAPATAPTASDTAPERPRQLFTLSAKTDEALDAYAGLFADYLEEGAASLADVCYTANVSRSDMRHRLAAPCASRGELVRALRSVTMGSPDEGVVRGLHAGRRKPRVAMLFTGQGSQRVGMGRELYESEPTFREVLDMCDELLAPHMERSLLSVIYPADEDEGASVLDDTTFTQPALFAIEYALAELWRSWGVSPTAVMGHSIGEYAAACVAGVIDVESGLRLVAERGRLMGSLQAGVGAMAVAFADEERVRRALDGVRGAVSVAAVNGPRNVVVSGDAAAIRVAEERLRLDGVDVRRLRVSHAFHSPLMDPILEAFGEVARSVEYRTPRIHLVSNLTGEVWRGDAVPDAEYWVRHLRHAVRFEEGTRSLVKQGCDVWIEAGPAPALLGMAEEVVPDHDGLWVPSLTKRDGEWHRLLLSVGAIWAAGAPVDWQAFHRGWGGARTYGLPTYPFQRERYWIDDPGPTAAVAPSAERDSAEVAAWLYEPDWERSHTVTEAPVTAGGTWLVLSDRRGLGAALARRLEHEGARCVQVFAGPSGAGVHDGDGTASLDPLDGEAAARLVADLGDDLEGIVHLWSLDQTYEDDASPEAVERALTLGCAGALHVLQALPDVVGANRPTVCLVTRGAQALAGSGADPAQAALWGLGRTAAAERPSLRCTRIDLDPEADLDASAAHIRRELGARDGETDVAFRGDARWVARLRRSESVWGPVDLASDGTYLVTGGLGGIGLRIAAWMVDRGARHLVLASRRGLPEDAETGPRWSAVRALEEKGACVVTPRVDVSRPEDVERLIEEIRRSMPPLRGVVHAAGVLDDGILAQQNWARFRTVLAPKVSGARNLARATSGESLDFFVLFSSAAGLLGSPGQANYAAANAFLGGLAHRRRAEGLPAVTIDWGPWDGVGMVAGLGARDRRRWTEQGVEPLAAGTALAALEVVLSTDRPQVGVLPVRWDRFAESFPPGGLPSLLREVASGKAGAAAPDTSEREREELLGRLREASPGAAAPLVRHYLRAEAARVLGLAVDRVLAEDPLIDFGLDSLMAVQLRNRLQEDLGAEVTVGELLEGATLTSLAQAVLPSLAERNGEGRRLAPDDVSTPEDLLASLDELSEEQVDALLQGMLEEGGSA